MWKISQQNDIGVCKLWQGFFFYVSYPFKKHHFPKRSSNMMDVTKVEINEAFTEATDHQRFKNKNKQPKADILHN